MSGFRIERVVLDLTNREFWQPMTICRLRPQPSEFLQIPSRSFCNAGVNIPLWRHPIW